MNSSALVVIGASVDEAQRDAAVLAGLWVNLWSRDTRRARLGVTSRA